MMLSFHFADSEMEAEGGWVTFPRSLSQKATEPGLEPGLLVSKACAVNFTLWQRGSRLSLISPC